MREDAEVAGSESRAVRARYEPIIGVPGGMTDAPRSEWSPLSGDIPRHSPPLIRVDGC